MSIDILQEKIRKLKCPIVVEMPLEVDQIPAQLCTQDPVESMATYCRELMADLKGIVPAVRFSFDHFAIMGPKGLQTLTQLLQEAHGLGYYVVLDGPSVNSPLAAQRAAKLLEEGSAFYCDGLILFSYIGSDVIRPFLDNCKSGKSVFFVVRTPNKSAVELQDLMTGSRLVHVAAADAVNRYGETVCGKCGYSQLGVVTSATNANSVMGLRGKYKRMFLMVDGLDYPGGNCKNASHGFDRFGHGCVLSIGAAITAAWKEAKEDCDTTVNHAVLAVERIRNNINRYISVL
jgi:orotidine-5'-phosphate decarboxylase